MKLSIVVPVYNESEVLKLFAEELQNTLQQIDYECIFVDDGSSDSSFHKIKQLSLENPRFTGISLSRNFGHQIALFAGLKESKGNIVITMDADLQHPPKVIHQLVKKHEQGYDIVNTKRIDASGTRLTKKLTSKWYYKLINLVSDTRIETASSDFRLLSRKAVNAFLSIPEKDRFNRGLVSWMGFKQSVISYNAEKRKAGNSKFTYKKMHKLGMDGLLSFSSKPLKLILNLGVICVLFGLAYFIYILTQHIQNNTVPGWTSTMIVILFLGGFQLISLGIIGQYIARIFNESKNRPMYFVKDKC